MSTVNSRASAGNFLTSRTNSRASSSTHVACAVSSRASFGSGHGRVSSRASFSEQSYERVNSRASFRNYSLAAEFHDFFVAMPQFLGSWGTATYSDIHAAVSNRPQVEVTAWWNGVTTPIPFLDWEVVQPRGETATLTLTVDNKDGWFSPGATEGPFTSKLEVDPYLDTGANDELSPVYFMNSYVWLTFKVGGQSFSTCFFLVMDIQQDDNPNSTKVTINGSDFSQVLLEGDHQMQDVDATIKVRWAKEVTAEILIRAGITQFEMDFEDWPVPSLHRVGDFQSWLRELWKIRQIWGFFRGRTYVLQAGGYDRNRSADWVFKDNQNIAVSKIRKTRLGAYNEAVLQRLDANTLSLYGPEDGRGLGYVTIQLKQPTTSATARIVGKFCRVYDYTWLNAAGGVLSSGEVYVNPTPAYALRFTVEPTPPFIAGQTSWEYSATVRGTAYSVLSQLGPFDSAYESHYIDSADQGVRGRHANPNVLVMPGCPNKIVGDDAVRRWVLEALRHYGKGELQVWLSPGIEPGQFAKFTCMQQGLEDYKMSIETVTHKGDTSSYFTTLELCRPRVA